MPTELQTQEFLDINIRNMCGALAHYTITYGYQGQSRPRILAIIAEMSDIAISPEPSKLLPPFVARLRQNSIGVDVPPQEEFVPGHTFSASQWVAFLTSNWAESFDTWLARP